MKAYLILLVCLGVFSSRGSASVSLFINTTQFVFDMEDDGYYSGNILFVDQYSIKTTDGTTTDIVVGSDVDASYVEGVGAAARFKTIFGFTQWNSSLLVVTDSGNHCLRFVNRLTNQTSRFVGNCTVSGFVDGNGADALFNYPYALTAFNSSFLLVSDNFNSALRLVDMKTGAVSTAVREISSPKDMVMASGGGQFYINSLYSVALVDVVSGNFTILTSTESGFQDGPLPTSKYSWPAGLDWLDNDTLVVADVYSNRTRMISLSQNEVSSMCAAVSPADDDDCSPFFVESVLKSGNALYIGGEGSINIMQLGSETSSGSTVSSAAHVVAMSFLLSVAKSLMV